MCKISLFLQGTQCMNGMLFRLDEYCYNEFYPRAILSVLDSELIDFSVDPFTGRNPSYCFVELETKDQAEQAMAQLAGRDILGRPVKIKPGLAKSSGDRYQRLEGSHRGDGTSLATFATFDRWRRGDPNPPRKDADQGQGRRVYVGGLPKVTDREIIASSIADFFTGLQVYDSANLPLTVRMQNQNLPLLLTVKISASCSYHIRPNSSSPAITITFSSILEVLKMPVQL